MERNTALKICIIGSGRLGSTLAYAIDNANSQEASIVSVSSRIGETLSAAKELLSNSPNKIFFTHDNLRAAKKSNCIFICTPDDEIEKTCREIFEAGETINNKKADNIFLDKGRSLVKSNSSIKNPAEMTVIHFSGSKKTNILDSARKAGASVACMHPLKSFASPEEAVKTLENTLYGVTYDKNDIKAKKSIDILSALLKGRIIFVENDKKTLYHACACIASNYLVSLMDFATDAGSEVGLDPRVFLGGLVNLSEGTLLNIKKLGTKKALTGPIARGDIGTISEHVETLKSLNREDIKELYTIMGKKTAKIALENTWINNKTYNELIKTLEK
ncbi:MAG: Rossmann-like and DUF2520 domain-containing protein [Candidatus Humimicrobiaceae bacterium]